MKRIIDGVAYNTATSTKVARMDYDNSSSGGPRGEDTLYQTKLGAFFLHEHEVISYQDRNRQWQERERDEFTPMTYEEAAAWCQNDVELLSDMFGDVPEATASDSAGTSAVVNVRMPASLKHRIEREAKDQGLSVNSYAMRCFEKCLDLEDTTVDIVGAWHSLAILTRTPEAFTKDGSVKIAGCAEEFLESALKRLGLDSGKIADIDSDQQQSGNFPNWLGNEHRELHEEDWG